MNEFYSYPTPDHKRDGKPGTVLVHLEVVDPLQNGHLVRIQSKSGLVASTSATILQGKPANVVCTISVISIGSQCQCINQLSVR